MFVVRLRGCEQTSFYSSIKTAEYPTIVGDAVVLVIPQLERHARLEEGFSGRRHILNVEAKRGIQSDQVTVLVFKNSSSP